ncbi:histone acetyltransferase MYST2 [Nematocida displodere]|uniref:histone acetyltransferase n=1 Tax=Nematocida displodere TaxID=1805483 RepID=A0A177ECK9_9MICR|nr:histone acetyltransferase MYST2 [Nematocida displodere]
MKCGTCTDQFHVEKNVEDKVRLLGKENRALSCDACGVCYVCFCREGSDLVRCILCGYHYHQRHQFSPDPENICANCASLHIEPEYASLIGPEISVFERAAVETDPDTYKRITDIIRQNKTSEKASDGIKEVFLGEVRMVPLFSSPYPEEYVKFPGLYICGRCLEYFSSEFVSNRHKKKCTNPFAPGRLLYLDSDRIGIFEVEGTQRQSYCQSLCLLAKMFLNHKTLYYDVEPFLFYIIGEVTATGFTIQGYFSKERGEGNNNLSCIVVFPPYRKTGLGAVLIDFSYYLSRVTARPPYTAGPEQPLSAEGQRVYLSYWMDSIRRHVLARKYFAPTAKGYDVVSATTGIAADSVKEAYLEMTKIYKKQPGFAHLLSNRGMIKRSRRMEKNCIVGESIEQKPPTNRKSNH